MPLLHIRLVNSAFQSRDEGEDYVSPEAALVSGEQAAASVARDDLIKGNATTAIEVRVETVSGKALLRSVVSLSVARLLAAE